MNHRKLSEKTIVENKSSPCYQGIKFIMEKIGNHKCNKSPEANAPCRCKEYSLYVLLLNLYERNIYDSENSYTLDQETVRNITIIIKKIDLNKNNSNTTQIIDYIMYLVKKDILFVAINGSELQFSTLIHDYNLRLHKKSELAIKKELKELSDLAKEKKIFKYHFNIFPKSFQVTIVERNLQEIMSNLKKHIEQLDDARKMWFDSISDLIEEILSLKNPISLKSELNKLKSIKKLIQPFKRTEGVYAIYHMINDIEIIEKDKQSYVVISSNSPLTKQNLFTEKKKSPTSNDRFFITDYSTSVNRQQDTELFIEEDIKIEEKHLISLNEQTEKKNEMLISTVKDLKLIMMRLNETIEQNHIFKAWYSSIARLTGKILSEKNLSLEHALKLLQKIKDKNQRFKVVQMAQPVYKMINDIQIDKKQNVVIDSKLFLSKIERMKLRMKLNDEGLTLYINNGSLNKEQILQDYTTLSIQEIFLNLNLNPNLGHYQSSAALKHTKLLKFSQKVIKESKSIDEFKKNIVIFLAIALQKRTGFFSIFKTTTSGEDILRQLNQTNFKALLEQIGLERIVQSDDGNKLSYNQLAKNIKNMIIELNYEKEIEGEIGQIIGNKDIEKKITVLNRF